VREITTALARRYMYHLDSLGLRPRTRRTLFIPLRALYKMLVEHGALETNAFSAVKLPKKDAAQPLLVGDEELQELFAAAARHADSCLSAFL
jgi:site-specific recombinase XerD